MIAAADPRSFRKRYGQEVCSAVERDWDGWQSSPYVLTPAIESALDDINTLWELPWLESADAERLARLRINAYDPLLQIAGWEFGLTAALTELPSSHFLHNQLYDAALMSEARQIIMAMAATAEEVVGMLGRYAGLQITQAVYSFCIPNPDLIVRVCRSTPHIVVNRRVFVL